MLGKEAAVFLPSGTMCNEIALLVHCRPGEEVICDRTAHIITAEGGGPAALAGAMVRALDGEAGVYSPAQLAGAVRAVNRYAPRSRLAVVEQTSNQGGGTIWPLETIEAVGEAARAHGLLLHMDGARLFNAVVETGVDAARYAAPFDSLWVDFSKGLGAPVGAVLAGRRELIEEAWVWKQRLGGAMRQAGIIAAGALYALEHHIERLAEDHANAKVLAEGLADIPGVTLDPGEVETNIVMIEVSESASVVLGRLLEQGVRVSQPGPHRLRAVTHLDISRRDVEEAVGIARKCFA
jgi:threonine aldolase